MTSLSEIKIPLDSVEESLFLWIGAKLENTLFDCLDSAGDNNEARYQICEGCIYDYEINNSDFFIGDVGENIVQSRIRNRNEGVLAPNIFVGTLKLPITRKSDLKVCKEVEIEVRSIKSSYREDYRFMLEYITTKCTELILQSNSPVSHKFNVDYARNTKAAYQKFAFIRSVITSREFEDSLNLITSSPVTIWSRSSHLTDVRNVKRYSSHQVRQLTKAGNRFALSKSHSLAKYGLKTLPDRIINSNKVDSIDTPENRFVKHALKTYLMFGYQIKNSSQEGSKLYNEATVLIQGLERKLHDSIFQDISEAATLNLNSPILQKKEGYRQVFRSWLMFDLAAKLTWDGGEDVYGASKKDIATLYEYWVFFQLLEVIQDSFKVTPKALSKLFQSTHDGLGLTLKQGVTTAISGVYKNSVKSLNIRFDYNRTFTGSNSYPNKGSWSVNLRPDYTISIWPETLTEDQAEAYEQIVHIHFDAKYKISNLSEVINPINLDEEKLESRKGNYKNIDIIKMHAYKDAIRRTGGAYVLYPGNGSMSKRGFHEIIPGLGAFSIKPSRSNSGIAELKSFILQVIEHLTDNTSQRERIAAQIYEIHNTRPQDPCCSS